MIEIVQVTEGEVRPVECVDDASVCVAAEGCLPRCFWIGLKYTVDRYLESVTLADILQPSFAERLPVA